MKTYLLLICLSITLGYTAGIVQAAETNYNTAMALAIQSDGTDAGIEQAMYNRGFNIDAMSSYTPSIIEKVNALFNN